MRGSKKYNVLLTGATGFVGAHLLSRLIQKENIKTIFVTSRQVDNNAMIHQATGLMATFAKYRLPFSGLLRKVRIIHGDISMDNIGLSDELYPQLSKVVDVIYHVAAEVNHMKSEEALEAANVDSLRALIAFSETRKQKIINFVSTMGSAVDCRSDGLFDEVMPTHQSERFKMGYLASKHKAEYVLSQCRHANLFRLGYVSGHSETGISLSHKNQLMMLIKSCIQMGLAPKLDRTLNLTPVDFVAEVMQNDTFLATGGHTLHVVNNQQFITWHQLIENLNAAGYPVRMVGVAEWQSKFVTCDRSNALYPMKLKYRRKDMDEHVLLFGKNIHQYAFDNINAFCRDHEVDQFDVQEAYFDVILGYLQASEFLEKPMSMRAAA